MYRVLLAALIVAGACSVSQAALVDGTISGGEYDETFADTPGESGYFANLDIDNLYTESDGSYGYIGLDVVTAPISTTGSDMSFVGTTGLMLAFYEDDTTATAGVAIKLTFDAAGLNADESSVYEWNGSGYDVTSYAALTAGTDYDAATDDALETSIAFSVFNYHTEADFPQYLRVQLDDSGSYADDQLATYIPEPAALTLLGLGAAGLLIRRRRR